jgi:3-dehydroquinate dehydratase/shikimate dehydrogenase
MGRFGLMSRVLAPKFGGFLTFASLRPSSATAPGQPTLSELLDLYRFRAITPKTRVYGVIGWPVEHSLSPAVHNAGFEALWPDTWEEEADASMGTAGTAEQGVQNDRNFEAVYLPLPVPPEWEHFKATLAAIIDHPRLDFGGCSVTLPHKGHLVRFAREAIADGGGGVEWSIDSLSEVCGAANTLVVERGPGGAAVRARVLNTDAMAAVSCLRKALLNGSVPEPADLSGVRVGLLGAGGVARSIAAGLLGAGAAVIVYNRTRANAERLVADLMAGMPERPDSAEIVAAELKDVGRVPCRALVNCTPVGMSGSETPGAKSEESGGTNRAPITLEQLSECSARAGDGKGPGDKPVVFDTVYTPLRTPLLDMAARAGLRTVDGLGMFVLQAAGQFAAWTGRPAPLGLFAQVAREALEERTAG